MKNQRKISFFIFSLIIAIGSLAAAVSITKSAGVQEFSQEELVSLSRPSVVRIVQHVQGEVIIKPFKLDLDRLTISPDAGESQKIPVDIYATGSGFIVSEDGYILTNSHVVSDKEIRRAIIAQAAADAIANASFFFIDFEDESGEISQSSAEVDPEKFQEYEERINDYLFKKTTFNLEQKTVVLDPSSKKDKIPNLMEEGFLVSVISINDNFSDDDWDAALIKIDQKNLPSLPLGQTTPVERGEEVGVFGFPQAAELDDKDPLVSTFSQGVVSAFRDSENKDFRIIQTDAKISEGSSGGPLLNNNGEVIGMITYQTNKFDNPNGDNFAFAIPINIVQEAINKFKIIDSDIKFESGKYHAQFSAGLGLLHEAKCKQALPYFENAKNVNDKFDAGANVEPYVKKCQELISAKRSMDTRWDKARQALVSLDDWVWAIVVAILLIFIVITVKLFTMKKCIKKDEKEIELLEEELKQNEEEDLEEQKEIKKIEKELDQIKNNKNNKNH